MRCFTVGFAISTLIVVSLHPKPAVWLVCLLLIGAGYTGALYTFQAQFNRVVFGQNSTSETRAARIGLFFAMGVVIGGLLAKHTLATQTPQILHQQFAGHDFTLTGTVVSVPKHDQRSSRFVFKIDQQQSEQLPDGVRTALRQVQLSWYGKGRQQLRAGDRWQLVARLKPPRSVGNPGGFDYAKWLYHNRVHATGYVRPKPAPRKLADNPSALHAIRESVAMRLALLPAANEFAPLVQGLTVGVKHNISTEQWFSLRQSGTAHLLAISGLHIGLVSGWFYFVGTLCWRLVCRVSIWPIQAGITKQVCGLSAGIASAVVYAALAGFSLPTQRALIMLMVFAASVCFRRVLPAGAGLLLAMLLVLLLDPLAVLSVGFWLSFGTVAALVFLHHGRIQRPSRARVLFLHLKLGVVLLPMTAWFFQQGSFVAPIANAFAVPIVGLVVVPLALVCVVALFLSPVLANWLLVVIQWLLDKLMLALDACLTIPLSTAPLFIPNQLVLLLLLVGLVLIFIPRGLHLRWLSIVLLAPAVLYNIVGKPVSGLEVHVLDVGQGLSTVLFTQNHTIVFDTGSRLSANSTMVSRVVTPFLNSVGRSAVDVAVISHADDDHAGGLADLVNAHPNLRVYASDESNLVGNAPTRCVAGESFRLDDVVFSFIHPGVDDVGSRNNLSCVLLVHYGKTRLLLAGDIEASAEKKIVTRLGAPIEVELLVAPHHGSRSSSTAEFLSTVIPKRVVFAAGENNKYGFPHIDVRERYVSRGVAIYNTGLQGAVTMQFNKDGLTQPVHTYWQGRKRFHRESL